jgi:hypothetical protein
VMRRICPSSARCIRLTRLSVLPTLTSLNLR